MTKLEKLTPGASLQGVVPNETVSVVTTQWHGDTCVTLTYTRPGGQVDNMLLYRNNEADLHLVEQGRPWSFDGDGALFRLVSEAQRIRLAHLFDPVLAIHIR